MLYVGKTCRLLHIGISEHMGISALMRKALLHTINKPVMIFMSMLPGVVCRQNLPFITHPNLWMYGYFGTHRKSSFTHNTLKCGADERSSSSMLRKWSLSPRRGLNPQPSDDRLDDLTTELPRLRWWAKVQIQYICATQVEATIY